MLNAWKGIVEHELFCIIGHIVGKSGGMLCVVLCLMVDCRNKAIGHTPDHCRQFNGRYQVPCWTRIVTLYTAVLYVFKYLLTSLPL
eukprot:COSAG05_NODE_7266_length_835_cov_1.259511_2_plen_85_part_01